MLRTLCAALGIALSTSAMAGHEVIDKQRGVANAYAFAKLFGYVRHFHPSDQNEATDWQAFAVEGMDAVQDVTTEAELAKILERLFHPVAPTIAVYTGGEPPQLHPVLTGSSAAAATGVVHWRHLATGQVRRSRSANSAYESRRVYVETPGGHIPQGLADPSQPYHASLGGSLRCRVPLALPFAAAGTLPTSDDPKKPALARSEEHDPGERSVRLASVAIAWNVFQHFYPYWDVTAVDWELALEQALEEAWAEQDAVEFLDVLRRMTAKSADGHAYVSLRGDPNVWYPPLRLAIVQDAVAVTDVYPGHGVARPGDIVLAVDGQPIKKIRERHAPLVYGGSPRQRRHVLAYRLLSGPKDTAVRIMLQQRSGAMVEVSLNRNLAREELVETRPEPIGEISPGIMYVDLGRVDNAALEDALPRLAEARGLIYDFRSYPDGVYPESIFAHLIDRPVESSHWQIPVISRPDYRGPVSYVQLRWKTIFPREPKFTARAAFLLDGRAVSHGESCLHYVETYHLGELIGEASAGTNGSVNFFTVPGGYSLGITGMRVIKSDGSVHHGLGIQPTVPVTRTLEGVAAGRDELLERALQLLSR